MGTAPVVWWKRDSCWFQGNDLIREVERDPITMLEGAMTDRYRNQPFCHREGLS
jgi:hypothetical protein